MRKSVLLAFVLLAAAMGGYGLATTATDSEPRTYYESLELTTPETAIDTFMAAFQRQDYWTVYLILSPKTQFTIQQNVNLLRYDSLLHVDDFDDFYAIIANQSIGKGHENWEHIGTGYYFDELMLAATQADRLLIDLRGDFTTGALVETVSDDGTPLVNVEVTVDGIDDPVLFRMVQTASQRWRVDSVILSGGDPAETPGPWIVP